jgi:predicted transcriptional regulator of viral defense system
MKKTKLNLAKTKIVKVFDGLAQKVFTRAQIEEILYSKREEWKLASSITTYNFIQFMLDETKLDVVKFEFPARNILRYRWGDVSRYELILSLKPKSYFSHYTAMELHGLTEKSPKTIYLNAEQSDKSGLGRMLDQDRIDNAFRRKPRISQNIASYKAFDLCILSGKHTGRLGVIEIDGSDYEMIAVTNIERTLIDITVRPFYSGGVSEVLRAYKLAREKLSTKKLAGMLNTLDYAYPYHQAVGFFLEKSGVYEDDEIEPLRKFTQEYDFYLAYQMKNKHYSKRWRLYYPKGL